MSITGPIDCRGYEKSTTLERDDVTVIGPTAISASYKIQTNIDEDTRRVLEGISKISFVFLLDCYLKWRKKKRVSMHVLLESDVLTK